MAADVPELYRRASASFGSKVQQIRDGQWADPTPCTEWDVRALVNHVVGENLWAPPLFAGRTIAEVGSEFDGDVLGAQPKQAWSTSADAAVTAVANRGAMDRTVHLSFGDFPGSEYALQLFADLLIHGWDLARATGQDESMDSEMVTACGNWFVGVAEMYRAGGAVAPPPDVPDTADPQRRLLAQFGRDAS